MKFSKDRFALMGVLLGVAVFGCGCQGEDPAASHSDEEIGIEIVCHFFYRPNTRTAGGEEKQVTITVPYLSGDVPEIALDIFEKAEFENLSCGLSAHYNVLNVQFFDSDHTISTILYQFADIPENGMAGGHGFTGLHYIYHQESEAELQFWAEVKGAGKSKSGEE